MSNVHRLRVTDCIFFVCVNLRPKIRRFDESEYGLLIDHRNPVRKGLAKRPEDWRWSSYNNFALVNATVAACPLQIDYVHLSHGYRA